MAAKVERCIKHFRWWVITRDNNLVANDLVFQQLHSYCLHRHFVYRLFQFWYMITINANLYVAMTTAGGDEKLVLF